MAPEKVRGGVNRVLWPILHYRIDLAEFTRRELTGYLPVIQHFADELSKVIRPSDLIWGHDYHFNPLGEELRKRGHANRIGFSYTFRSPPLSSYTSRRSWDGVAAERKPLEAVATPLSAAD